jgi:purine nucleosidase
LTREAVPVVFDTDIGTNVDDALALALALASPEIRLVAVSVVNGDATTLHLRARIAARLLGLAGRADVPVLRGHPERLSASDRYSHLGHEGEGLLEYAHDGADATIHDTPAADWLVAHSHDEPLHVVATGPLTTVAVALQRDPALAHRLRHLTVMGGSVHPDKAERDYNTACDPLAALVCAISGVPITWVTIDTTLQTAMTAAALQRIRDAHTPLLDALARLTEIWLQRRSPARYHDPLAMASVFGGPWLTLRTEHLDYSVHDGLFRLHPGGGAHHAAVSQQVDSDAFEAAYLERVLAAFADR